MRLIDADVLLDNIRRDSKKAIDEGDKVGSFWLGYAAGLVIKQPTIQPEPQWIPVNERLPDTNRDVLLQFSTSMGVGFWGHNSWGVNTGDNIYSEIGEGEAQPIAWMPLPKPFEGGIK